MTAGKGNATLNRAFAAARDQHGPSVDEWATLSEYINTLPGSGGGTPGAGGLKQRWARLAHRLLRRPGTGVIGGGLAVLGLALWGVVGPLGGPGPAGRGHTAGGVAEVNSVELAGSEQSVAIASLALGVQLPSTPALAERWRPQRRAGRKSTPPGSNANLGAERQQTDTGTSASSPAVSSVNVDPRVSPPDDGPLLRDIARLTQVESALGRRDPLRALSLLDSAPAERLHGHARVLRALALCQLGKHESGRKLLLSASQSGAPQRVRAHADAECEPSR